MSLRIFLLLLSCQLVASLSRVSAAEALPSSGKHGLNLASTNGQMLVEVRQKPSESLAFDANDGYIARLVSEMLMRQHYVAPPFNDAISSKFLDRYIETLDGLHLHFLQSDLAEFEPYRTNLDNLMLKRESDLTPARVIFKRFLERLDQRVAYVHDLLETETFTFDGDDGYNTNRKEARRPANIEEARQLWRQHLRFEVLSEKLAKEKPAEIAGKINRRYARLMRTFKELDGQDVFEIYLSALTHVYDPHSDYMGKSSLENFNVGMALSLFGIGALLQSEDGYCKIKSLVPGGPAERSKKLKENDRIIAVAQGAAESVDVVDTKLSKVVELIRGPKNTEVRLTVIPGDAPDSSVRKVISLIRDEIKLEDQEAKARVIDVPAAVGKTTRLGLIDLPSFYANFDEKRKENERKSTTADVKKLLNKLLAENVGGIILDLRRNGGGSLEEAINLTGLFIKEGPVVQVRDPDGKVGVDEDPDPSILYAGPLIVLTSRFSASASEILAGALQDYGRALIVGDSSTHGKGTVQSLMGLERYMRFSKSTNNPGALKLTIRKFYRAAGSSTQLKGVVPDIVLPSVNNYAEVGESSLENPLVWDTIKSAEFDPMNLVPPILPELRKRSDARVAGDKDFAYVAEDIAQYRKAIADKTVSLNEMKRMKERDEMDARRKARQAELKLRKDIEEKVYEITLKLADQPGLPPAVSKTNTVAKAAAATDPHASVDKPAAAKNPDGDDEEDEGDVKTPRIDVSLKEAKRILADLIDLWPSSSTVVKSLTPNGAGRVD
jgi:carboxyl-terminal processing protease